jgi:rare lipoprotein A
MPAPVIPPIVAPAPEPRNPAPAPAPSAAVQTGIASWYGKPFHGRRTANGEIFNMHAMTAAHRTMPLPSYARVRNPANGREIVVRVNDRGPFKPGRIIDLSYAAAKRLGIEGIAPVEVTVLPRTQIARAD